MFKKDVKDAIPPVVPAAERQLFHFMCKGLDSAELRNRTIAMIFRLVKDWVLSKPYFGLDSCPHRAVMEKGLSKFEQMTAKAKREKSIDVLDWRACTVRVAVGPGATGQMAQENASRVSKLLQPLISPEFSTEERKALDRIMLKAFKAAFDMLLAFRRSRDFYTWETPKNVIVSLD